MVGAGWGQQARHVWAAALGCLGLSSLLPSCLPLWPRLPQAAHSTHYSLPWPRCAALQMCSARAGARASSLGRLTLTLRHAAQPGIPCSAAAASAAAVAAATPASAHISRTLPLLPPAQARLPPPLPQPPPPPPLCASVHQMPLSCIPLCPPTQEEGPKPAQRLRIGRVEVQLPRVAELEICKCCCGVGRLAGC